MMKYTTEIKVDEIMRDIRESVLRSHIVSDDQNMCLDIKSNQTSNKSAEIIHFIDEAQQHSSVGTLLPPMHTMRGIKRFFATIIGRITIRIAQIITRDQRIVNNNLLSATKLIYEELKSIEGRNIEARNAMDKNVEANKADLIKKINDICDEISKRIDNNNNIENKHNIDIQNMQANISKIEDMINNKDEIESKHSFEIQNIQENIRHIEEGIESIVFEASKNNNEIPNMQEYIKYLENQIGKLRAQLHIQEQRLSLIFDKAQKWLPESFSTEQANIMKSGFENYQESNYVDFENKFRGTREEIKERVRFYLPYIKNSAAGDQQLTIIDLGCGRGELIEVINAEGYKSVGIDLNKYMIYECEKIGLNVIHNDAISYLKTLKDRSIGAITALQLVEHLDTDDLFVLFDEALRVLAPGGIIIFETPNPQNLIVGACNFYTDLTHKKPIPPDVLKFIAETKGFTKPEIVYWSKRNSDDSNVKITTNQEMDEIREFMNHWIKAPADYAVIGWRS